MRVLHILPRDMPRGAQVFAQALVDFANGGSDQHHEIAVLFSGEHDVLNAQYRLHVPPGRLRSIGFQPAVIQPLRSLVKSTEPDVLVAHGSESMKYAIFAQSPDTRLIGHSIGVAEPSALRGGKRALYSRLWRRADTVVAVSTDVGVQLREAFSVPSQRLVVIPNGRSVGSFATWSPGTEVRPRLVFVGRLVPSKRPPFFIEVVRRLRARGWDFEAFIIGDGPMRNTLLPLGASCEVQFLRNRNDVPAQLARSSILLFTSEIRGEGMPGVLIEAGLAGLPVVSTDVPGARDVIADGETGTVVGVDDLDGFTDAVELLLANAQLRSSLGAAARERCNTLFSLDTSARLWIATIGNLVSPLGLRR